MRTWPLVLALAACQNGGGDDYAVVPGGPGVFGGGTTGGTGIGDGGPDGNGDGGVTAKVCLLTDLRKLMVCAPTDITGLTVKLGTTSTATTGADGSFSIVKPPGTALTWHVSGMTTSHLAVVTTAVPYAAQALIPVVGQLTYNDLLNSNSVPIIQDQQGSLVLELLRAGVPLVGAKVALAPVSDNNTEYDSNNPSTWNANGSTGAFGVVWAPGVRVTTTTPQSFTVTPLTGSQVTGSAAIENQAITFATQEVP